MGGCTEREEYKVVKENAMLYGGKAAAFSKEKYAASAEYIGPKWEAAQVDHKDKFDFGKKHYDIARMKMNGWSNETVVDDSKIKFISEFEKDLPLRNISLLEYERRLKKLVTPSMEDYSSVKMVIECFKDHWAFTEIDT